MTFSFDNTKGLGNKINANKKLALTLFDAFMIRLVPFTVVPTTLTILLTNSYYISYPETNEDENHMTYDYFRFTWETTISQSLGKKLKGVHRGYHNCSLLNLMTHTSGIAAHPGNHVWTTAWGMTELNPMIQRHKYATAILSQRPVKAIGQYLYSNSNYAVLGCILEEVSGHSFEELVMSLIAKPLGISTVGIGPAGSKEKDKAKAKANPWGHDAHQNPQDPHRIQSDNPEAIAPAGKLHMSMGDWGRFVSVHMHPKLLHRLVSYDGEDNVSSEDKGPFNVLHQPLSSRPQA